MSLSKDEIRELIKEQINKVFESKDYKKSKKSKPEINKLVDEFNAMPEEQKNKEVLLWWMLGKTTQHFKMDRDVAEYADESKVKDQYCNNCPFMYTQYATGKHICSKIKGEIKPMGWCKLWVDVRETPKGNYQ